MQVSTGNLYPTADAAYLTGVLPSDLIMLTGTPDQIAQISRAVKRGHAADAKKVARRAAQRSKRANR